MDEAAHTVHFSTLLMIAYQLPCDTCMVVVIPSTEYKSCVQRCALRRSSLLKCYSRTTSQNNVL